MRAKRAFTDFFFFSGYPTSISQIYRNALKKKLTASAFFAVTPAGSAASTVGDELALALDSADSGAGACEGKAISPGAGAEAGAGGGAGVSTCSVNHFETNLAESLGYRFCVS